MENSMEVPQKTKNRTTIWSSNSAPGYISGKSETTNSKRYICYSKQHCLHCLQYNLFISRWMDKEDAMWPNVDGLREYYA